MAERSQGAVSAVGAAAPRPRVWTVFAAFWAALAAILLLSAAVFMGLVSREAGLAGLGDPDVVMRIATSGTGMALSILISSGMLAGVALVAAHLSPLPLRQRLRLRTEGRFDALDGLLATLGVLGLGEAMSSAAGLFDLIAGTNLALLARVSAEMPLSSFLMVLVVGSLGAGIAEELFFRGYMQTRLSARWGKVAGVAITAAFFGLIHFDVLHAPLAAVMGLYFGWLAEARGTVVLTIVAHVGNNALSFVINRALPASFGDGVHAALLVTGLAVAALTTWALWRRRPFCRQDL